MSLLSQNLENYVAFNKTIENSKKTNDSSKNNTKTSDTKTNDTKKQDYDDYLVLLEKYVLNKSNYDKEYKTLNQEQIK